MVASGLEHGLVTRRLESNSSFRVVAIQGCFSYTLPKCKCTQKEQAQAYKAPQTSFRRKAVVNIAL